MKILNFIKGIRTHWKKSTFAACAITYGASYMKDSYEIANLMRNYCEEAETYGDAKIDAISSPQRILVLLNPAANKRSAEKNFRKYCEPILHLAGYLVEIIQTDSVGHARRYVEELEVAPYAILVAGGDGTVSETVTGLLRRSKNDLEKCPIGILPVGRTNQTISKYINLPEFPNNVEKVQCLADSAIAIVRGKIEKKDILKVQPVIDENVQTTDELPRPIYALYSFQWGAFKDAQNLRDNYWYYGSFREYASTLFNAFRNNKLTWNCKSTIISTPPCSGCSNCYIKNEDKIISGRWWSRFIPKFKLGQSSTIKNVDYSKIINDNCNAISCTVINPSEIIIELNTNSNSIPMLTLNVTDSIDSGIAFIQDNWNRIKTGNINTSRLLEGRTIELIPENPTSEGKEKFYYIDNEPYEVRPIKLAIIPNAVNFFVL